MPRRGSNSHFLQEKISYHGSPYSFPTSSWIQKVALKTKFSFRGEKKCPTPAPTPTPTGPFYPYADNQRCLEGELALQSIASVEACWNYCSLYGGTPTPFYFAYSAVTEECYCCGATCTLFYDPGFTAYIATELATSPPTRSPTTFNTTGSRRRLMEADMLAAKAREEADVVTLNDGEC